MKSFKDFINEVLVSNRKKDWPKGSIEPTDKKTQLAADLINLQKQGAPGWSTVQLRKKKK